MEGGAGVGGTPPEWPALPQLPRNITGTSPGVVRHLLMPCPPSFVRLDLQDGLSSSVRTRD